MSALQVSRQTGVSYKSTLFTMHRVRYATTPNGQEPLSGTVEVDEAYVGGKPRYRQGDVSRDKAMARLRGRGTRKIPVVAMVQRGGEVRAVPVHRVNAATLKTVIGANITKGSNVMTDDAGMYRPILRRLKMPHESVNHSQREYVRGEVTTNTVEGFFSLLKRGLYGTFHSVSEHHLHRYVSEFAFRYNARYLDDGERTIKAIAGAEGKRLTYRWHGGEEE